MKSKTMESLIYYSGRLNHIIILERQPGVGYFYEDADFYFQTDKHMYKEWVKDLYGEEYEVIGEL